jgi:transglutaminase-like putative cysteine protease
MKRLLTSQAAMAPATAAAVALSAATFLMLAAPAVPAQGTATSPPDQWRDVEVAALIENAPDEEDYPDASAVFLNLQEMASVAENGSVTTTRNRLIKVLTLRGRERYSNQAFLYNTDSEALTVVKGVTVRKSGRVVEVEEDAINDVTPAFLEGATMYANVFNKVISFPVAGPGSTMELQLLEERKPASDTSYSGIEHLGARDPLLQGSFAIRYPEGADSPVTAGLSGELGGEMRESSRAGEIVYSVADVAALVEEEHMPPAAELYPTVLYSSYRDWSGPAAFFADAFYPHVQTDGAMAGRVADVTTGLTDQADIVRAIFLDVTTEIRNVHLNLGIGGYEPNDAEIVLENKYADTRDKAVLLVSMLRTAGIDAYPVLVAGATDARFTESVPTLSQFTRILVAYPDATGVRFLDPFLDDAFYGFLRWGRGNAGLLVRDDGSGELVAVPGFSPEENRAHRRMAIALDTQGDAKVTATSELAGYFDRKTRLRLKDLKPSEADKVFDASASAVTAGAVETDRFHSDLSDLTEPVVVSQSIDAEGFAVAQGDMMIVHLPGFPFEFANMDVTPSLAERKYAFEYPCEFESGLEIALTLPEGYEIAWVPEGSTIDAGAATFELACGVSDDGRSILWRQSVTVSDRSIPVESYSGFKESYDRSASPKNQLVILRKV